MEDKIFELMSKMYSDMTQKMDHMAKRMDNVENHIIKLEDKIDTQGKALFGGYKQTYEKLTTLETKVDELSSKIQKQDVEIRVIKNVANN
ncbi:hypothetical protein [Cellulosilyticum sp. I15G10I2]|uniref:hypothetical protein n=1 Tax=Cellulosilyticum sp. I15G10I2 TaxID=1892843 RepID=UPI00085C3048|nr:hypothetical protein [Cellulosilyticum sp. I15G10I2]